VNYNCHHQFYGGVELHASSMFVHILDHKRKTVFDYGPLADPDQCRLRDQAVRKNLVVGCACLVAGYWRADLCAKYKNPLRTGPRPGQEAQLRQGVRGAYVAWLRSGSPAFRSRQTQAAFRQRARKNNVRGRKANGVFSRRASSPIRSLTSPHACTADGLRQPARSPQEALRTDLGSRVGWHR
jgi:hypothetical protein